MDDVGHRYTGVLGQGGGRVARHAGPGASAVERIVRLITAALGEHFDPKVADEASSRLRAGLPEHVPRDAVRLVAASELCVAFAEALTTRSPVLEGLLEALEVEEDVTREALAIAILRSSGLGRLPVAVAGRVILSMLVGLARCHGASVWRLAGGVPERVMAAQEDVEEPTRVVALTRAVLDSENAGLSRGDAVVVTIDAADAGEPIALAAWGPGAGTARRAGLLEAAAVTLTSALERARLSSKVSVGSEDAAATAQRRLNRLRFDLHDGPQQDVLLLAEDLRLFGSQLGRVLDDHPDRDRLLGRVEDLEARLVALDGDLRRISSSLRSPFLEPGSLPDAVADLSSAFCERTGIVPDVNVSGDMTRLTDSQHITLIGLLREALSNVREHSEATSVIIRVRAGEDGVSASVCDDGRGFDPETSLLRAAREGHLGLVGMHERVRMLGGHTRIESRPGGPTIISVELPAAPDSAPRHV